MPGHGSPSGLESGWKGGLRRTRTVRPAHHNKEMHGCSIQPSTMFNPKHGCTWWMLKLENQPLLASPKFNTTCRATGPHCAWMCSTPVHRGSELQWTEASSATCFFFFLSIDGFADKLGAHHHLQHWAVYYSMLYRREADHGGERGGVKTPSKLSQNWCFHVPEPLTPKLLLLRCWWLCYFSRQIFLEHFFTQQHWG